MKNYLQVSADVGIYNADQNEDGQIVGNLTIATAIKENIQIADIENYKKLYFGLATKMNYYIDDLEPIITPSTPGITYEVIDIPGLMMYILGMPFSFISTAFNLTLFQGTQYQINISSIFMTIVFALLLIFIIRKLTR